MDLHENERLRIAKGPEIMFPSPVHAAVRAALGLPVHAVVRTPVQGGYQFEFRRIK